MNWKRVFKFRESSTDASQEQTFIEHLEDLRTMLIKMAVVLGIAMILSFIGRTWLFYGIQAPLTLAHLQHTQALQSLGVVDSFAISLELAFYAGLILSFPFLLYFLAEFTLPALYASERRVIIPLVAGGVTLFLSGLAFAYFFVLPQTLHFFYHDAQSLGWNPTWTVREYYSFATQFLIAFGLAFELPIIVLMMVKLDILSVKDLKRLRPQAIIVIFILAAVLTPTTDMLTMLLMGIPMIGLYEMCIGLARLMELRKGRKRSERML